MAAKLVPYFARLVKPKSLIGPRLMKNKNWKPLQGKRLDWLVKVRQVWNNTKINRVECDTHKNVRANWVETVQKNKEETKSIKLRVQSPALWQLSAYFQQERKWVLGQLLISIRNRKRESAVKVVANEVHIAKFETESHLRRRKRKQLGLMTADVWVWMYWSTLYNKKGTTWLGSPLLMQAQQDVRQH
jgi:hypothetical protein